MSLNWLGREKKWLLSAYAKKREGTPDATIHTAGAGIDDSLSDASTPILDERLDKFHQARARGAFIPETNTIALLKGADLSTFLHESGHFYLESLIRIAGTQNAPADVAADAQAILDWFGVPDLATWEGLTLEQRRPFHEQFARGFEAYLFEGKAPSMHLQGIFSRFRAWLVSVYKSLTALNVGLTDEVRTVMARLVATQEEIEAMQAARLNAPLYATKPETMTEAEWLAYQAMGSEATDAALANFQARRLKDIAARMSREGKAAYKAIRGEAQAEIEARPVYRVRKYLTHGTLPDGTQAGEPVKLSRPALAGMYGEGDQAAVPWRSLPTGRFGLVAAEGAHPDVVAENFGYDSGDALVRELIDAPPPDLAIRELAEERFAEVYGDAFTPEQVQQAAADELANESRGQQLTAELTALSRATNTRAVPYKAAKQFADKAVAAMPVQRARDARPHTFAESRAGKATEKALIVGDMPAAAKAKRDQVLNHQLARASRQARAEVEDFLGRIQDMFKPDAWASPGTSPWSTPPAPSWRRTAWRPGRRAITWTLSRTMLRTPGPRSNPCWWGTCPGPRPTPK